MAQARLETKLRDLVGPTTIGIASFPSDGRDAESLAARAGARAHPERTEWGASVVPTSPAMEQLHALAARIAKSRINVLILGETGAGKEWLAQTVHRQSDRASRPFLAVNVPALTETLLESELFGHERGAFTGAVAAKPGILETAHGGTVFLDEIGEMPISIQAKLLRVLETRQVQRVGGIKPREIDVRFIAATNRDLEAESARGAFREDLYFRLNGVSLYVPPLRERTSEIEPLVRAFIVEACDRYGRPRLELSSEARELMLRYPWPGNVRELRNVVERAVVIASGAALTLNDLPVEKMSATFAARRVRVAPRPQTSLSAPSPVEWAEKAFNASPGPAALEGQPLRNHLQQLERQRIIDALAACAGNQTDAAKMLGMPRRTLVHKLGVYGIPGPRRRRRAGAEGA